MSGGLYLLNMMDFGGFGMILDDFGIDLMKTGGYFGPAWPIFVFVIFIPRIPPKILQLSGLQDLRSDWDEA